MSQRKLGLNINFASCLLLVAYFVAGAFAVLWAWASTHWLPGTFPDLSGFFLLFFFAVGIGSGVAIPRRLWVGPVGVAIGFYVTCLCVGGGASGLGFGLFFLRRAAIVFGIVSLAGALAGALLSTAVRILAARRHRIA